MRVSSAKRRLSRFDPMIHSLGMDSVPVDESSNGGCGRINKQSLEGVPSTALALLRVFSTRLSDWA